VYFDQGRVVGVQTTFENERIGMVLYKFGVIDEAQHEAVMVKVRDGKRYGAASVELGFLTQDQVYHYLARQIDEVVYATLTVGDGTFFFLDGYDDARLVAHHTVSANALLMDAVTRMDEMRYFQEKIPSADYVPSRTGNSSAAPEEYRATLDAVDAHRSVEEIGRVTGRGEFATTKDLYALIQSKHVVMHPPRMSGGLAALVAIAGDALRIVHKEADAEGVGSELRQSLGNFAVGAGVYEILFRGAGPDDQGALDADRVADNASLVAGANDPEYIVKQMLSDYVGFAVFSIGGMLGEEREAQIGRQVATIVARLHPDA
jgi:hypothetical protein